MNTLLLHPTDTLFFRDGRPMSGSLSGHGAAWPLPTVLNAALHAALHRADLEKVLGDRVHGHDQIRLAKGSRERIAEATRKFGSLLTAGPFPVQTKDDKGQPLAGPQWFFPRPLDAGIRKQTMNGVTLEDEVAAATLLPLQEVLRQPETSLPSPLQHPVANLFGATKKAPSAWWTTEAWTAYINAQASPIAASSEAAAYAKLHFQNDTDFSDTEHNMGIGISAETGTQNGEQFYSAHSLRLREGWSLGTLAEAQDKKNGDPNDKRDLLATLFPNNGTRTPVIVGGQQRLCTVERHSTSKLPLPIGPAITGTLVKWVLLTPAIFPEIGEHKGGWLPSWIHHASGQVMLKQGNTNRLNPEGREAWRKRVAQFPSIQAKLVAAITGKALPVTGYALPHEAADREHGGAKSTHLAVPAGSVYYFEADTPEAAQALAAALNWHGAGDTSTIRNRRSTLMGEKGFGLGVCGTWNFHDGNIP